MALNIKNGEVKRLAAEVARLTVPKAQAGRRLTRAEEDGILGYGPRRGVTVDSSGRG